MSSRPATPWEAGSAPTWSTASCATGLPGAQHRLPRTRRGWLTWPAWIWAISPPGPTSTGADAATVWSTLVAILRGLGAHRHLHRPPGPARHGPALPPATLGAVRPTRFGTVRLRRSPRHSLHPRGPGLGPPGRRRRPTRGHRLRVHRRRGPAAALRPVLRRRRAGSALLRRPEEADGWAARFVARSGRLAGNVVGHVGEHDAVEGGDAAPVEMAGQASRVEQGPLAVAGAAPAGVLDAQLQPGQPGQAHLGS